RMVAAEALRAAEVEDVHVMVERRRHPLHPHLGGRGRDVDGRRLEADVAGRRVGEDAVLLAAGGCGEGEKEERRPHGKQGRTCSTGGASAFSSLGSGQPDIWARLGHPPFLARTACAFSGPIALPSSPSSSSPSPWSRRSIRSTGGRAARFAGG